MPENVLARGGPVRLINPRPCPGRPGCPPEKERRDMQQARPAPWRRWSRGDLRRFGLYSFAAGYAAGFVAFAILWGLAT